MSVTPHIAIALIVAQDEKDVRLNLGGVQTAGGEKQREKNRCEIP